MQDKDDNDNNNIFALHSLPESACGPLITLDPRHVGYSVSALGAPAVFASSYFTPLRAAERIVVHSYVRVCGMHPPLRAAIALCWLDTLRPPPTGSPAPATAAVPAGPDVVLQAIAVR